MTQPFDMIIIGATGDLARRKLVPALYNLHHFGALSDDGRIFAVGRSEADAESFLPNLEEAVREHVKQEVPDATWQSFAQRFQYTVLEATDPSTYGELKKALKSGDDERVRIFYLATPPSLYGDISQSLSEVGLVTPATRIVLEKPIGSDLDSAREINRRVGEVFAKTRSTASTTTSAKRRCRTSWRCASPTPLRAAVARRAHRPRADHRRRDPGRRGTRRATTTRPARCATWCRTTCCSCSASPPWSRPRRLDQDSIREEKIKVLRSLRPMSAPKTSAQDRARRSIAGLIPSKKAPGK